MNSLAFGQRPEALYLDLTEMDEEIFTLRLLNESVALLGTKPLDSPLSQPYDLHVFRSDPASPSPPHSTAMRVRSLDSPRATVPEPVTPVKTKEERADLLVPGGSRHVDPYSTSRNRWVAR